MADYEIRSIRQVDIPQLVELCREHAAFEQTPYQENNQTARLSEALFDEKPALYGLVVVFEAGIVGYATYMMQYATWDAAEYLYLDCLYLRPEARRHGLGHKIMMRLQKLAQECGCVNMQWQTPPFNHNAIEFYENIGAEGKPKIRLFFDTV